MITSPPRPGHGPECARRPRAALAVLLALQGRGRRERRGGTGVAFPLVLVSCCKQAVKKLRLRVPRCPLGISFLGRCLPGCPLPGPCGLWLPPGCRCGSSRTPRTQPRWIVRDMENDTLNWFQMQGCFKTVLALIASRSFMLHMFSGQIKRHNSHQTPVQRNYHKSLLMGPNIARPVVAWPWSLGRGAETVSLGTVAPCHGVGSPDPCSGSEGNLTCSVVVSGAMTCGEKQECKTIAGNKSVDSRPGAVFRNMSR